MARAQKDADIPEGKPSPQDALRSVAHLVDTLRHNHAHGHRHLYEALECVAKGECDAAAWNFLHAQHHVYECWEHADKLVKHLQRHRKDYVKEVLPYLGRIGKSAISAGEHYIEANESIISAAKLVEKDLNPAYSLCIEAWRHMSMAENDILDMVRECFEVPKIAEEFNKIIENYPGRAKNN